MRKLVFFLGPAGAGKTTLTKALAAKRGAAFFDMDTLLRPAAEAVMTMAGLDPNDRDSAEYKRLCRDLGYRITMDVALDNVRLHADVFVVGPFTKETDDPLWIEAELARIGASLTDVEVKVVFAYLEDTALYRERIEARGSVLDAWKLDHWAEFSRSLTIRDIRWNIPSSSILYFDNSAPLSESSVTQVERFLYGEPTVICHVSLEEVWKMRHEVMWPNQELSFVKLPEDMTGYHFGLTAGTEHKLVSVISLFIDGEQAQFRKFATLPEEQGKGYGSRLLQFTLDEARRRGARTIRCNARASKVGLYRKFGMQETDQRFLKGGIEFVVLEAIL